jgi:hypothetical protein
MINSGGHLGERGKKRAKRMGGKGKVYSTKNLERAR